MIRFDSIPIKAPRPVNYISVAAMRDTFNPTIHHLCMATLKACITEKVFRSYKSRYKECIRMLNGMDRSLEKCLPGTLNTFSEAG